MEIGLNVSSFYFVASIHLISYLTCMLMVIIAAVSEDLRVKFVHFGHWS